tara:strand:- start:1051 stop:1365 length:315 start_codon:yes stop_codon:yes gene_type:complete
MPKTTVNYNNKKTLKMSGQFLNYIQIARRSKAAQEKFGVIPTETEFLRGVIYNWIKKYTPEILINDLEGNVPEILEHKALKKNHEKALQQTKDFVDEHFKNRKK